MASTPRADGRGHKPVPRPFEIRLSESAERVYREMAGRVDAAEQRGDFDTAHHTALRMVNEVLDQIVPLLAVDRRNALSGVLSGMYRAKKGRMRKPHGKRETRRTRTSCSNAW